MTRDRPSLIGQLLSSLRHDPVRDPPRHGWIVTLHLAALVAVWSAFAWIAITALPGSPSQIPGMLAEIGRLAGTSEAMAAFAAALGISGVLIASAYLIRQMVRPLNVVAEFNSMVLQGLDSTSAGVVIVDAGSNDAPIIYTNRAFTQITGYKRDEAIGKNPRFLHGEATDPATVDEIRHDLSALRPSAYRVLNYRKDGSPFWNDLRISPIQSINGRVRYFLGVLVDATAEVERERTLEDINAELERRVVERTAALQASQAHLQGILDNIADMVVTIDSRGRITSSNSATTQLLGWTQSELIGRDVSVLATDPDRSRHPSYIARYRETGESRILGVRARELTAARKDGSTLPIELTIGRMKTRGEDYFIGVMRDISLRRAAELEIEKTRSRLSEVVSSANEAIALFDADDRLVLFNSAYRGHIAQSGEILKFGRGYEELLRLGIERGIIHPGDVESDRFIAERLAAHRAGDATPWRYKSGDGRWLQVTEKRTLDGGTAIVAADITQLVLEQEQVVASEAKFRTLAAAMPFGLCVLGLHDGRYRFANARASDLLGVAPEDLLSRKAIEIDSVVGGASWVRAVESGEPLAIAREKAFRRNDGTLRWFDIAAVAAGYEGAPCAIVGIYDVTEQREAREALRKSERKLAKAQEIAQTGSWEIDLTTYELEWSAETYRIFGLSPDGEKITFDAFMTMIHPDDYQAVRSAGMTARQSHRHAYDVEHRILRRDGSVRHVRQLAEMTRDAKGKAVHLTGTIRDITDQKVMEEALRQYAEELRLITDSLPMIVTYVDTQEMYRFANRAACDLYNRRPEEIVGQPVADVLLPESYAKVRPHMDRALRGEQVRFEETLSYRNGETRQVEVHYIPHRSDGETLLGYFTVVSDLTSRIELEEQLRQAQKMEVVGQLTGGIAHDFNNFLGVVLGNLDLVLPHVKGQPKVEELIGRAIGAVDRAASLTRRLLAFSRRHALAPGEVDVGEVLRETHELIRQSVGEAVTVELSIESGLWSCHVDRVQFESVMMNLCLNARDAMPNGGRLAIQVSNLTLAHNLDSPYRNAVEGNHVEIAVTDTGKGMPPEIATRIFEPFFTTKEVGKGTGLGLSMVYGFVRQSGGDIAIESRVGVGTTIRFILPRIDRDATALVAETGASAPADHELDGGGRLILVVEDNYEMRNYAVAALAQLGYRTLEAGEVGSGLALIEERADIAAVLCDVILPGGRSGLDLAREVASLRPGLPTLLTSGFTGVDSDVTRDLVESGRMLFKPYRVSDLARKIDALLRQHCGVTDKR